MHHIKTTAYHLAANGKLERWHRYWVSKCPTVILGLRAYAIPEFNTTSAKLTYGVPIRLAANFFVDQDKQSSDFSALLPNLKKHLQNLKPFLINQRSKRKFFIYPELATSLHVLIRHYAIRKPLQLVYNRSFPVVSHTGKNFVITNPEEIRQFALTD